MSVNIRDRVKELRRVKASELMSNPLNWRVHTDEQRAAIQTVLKQIGITGALVAYETEKGLVLLDGHLRKEDDPDTVWPVLITDLTEDEAALDLLVRDPIGAMAQSDQQKIEALMLLAPVDGALATALVPFAGESAFAATGPENFRSYDESIAVEHTCPKCGYKFSGGKVEKKPPTGADDGMLRDAEGRLYPK